MNEVINIEIVNVGMIGTNCYIVYKENNQGKKEGFIVDPGDDAHKIKDVLDRIDIRPVAIVLTHGHFDHILAVNDLVDRYNIDVYACGAEKELLADKNMNLSGGYRRDCVVENIIELSDNQKIDLAGIGIKTIHTPGHTKGSMCYFVQDMNTLFSGDMLFRESIGRTDFPTGSEQDIVMSFNEKLMKLDDNIKVYPGHGEYTTIGYERYNNILSVG